MYRIYLYGPIHYLEDFVCWKRRQNKNSRGLGRSGEGKGRRTGPHLIHFCYHRDAPAEPSQFISKKSSRLQEVVDKQ